MRALIASALIASLILGTIQFGYASPEQTENQAESSYTWGLIDSISKQIEVRQGGIYFVQFSQDNGLEEIALPSSESGLTQKALSALDKVPKWLYDELAKKFAELSEVSIDVGNNATPLFADLDGDADLDLTVGEESGSLNFYRNVGTKYLPIFVDDSETIFHEIPELQNADPAIADLDGDNDLDLAVGVEDGTVLYFRNTGTIYDPAWKEDSGLFEGIDVGSYATPCFGDLDGDGDYDLTIGAGDGTLVYYENVCENPEYISDNDQSTTTEPEFVLALVNPYAGIDIGDRSNPALADMDADGDLDLTVGDGDTGILHYYENTLAGFVSDGSEYSGITLPYRTVPALADLDGDGCYDLAVGVNTGLIYYYENIGTASESKWLTWSTYEAWPGFVYYEPDTFLQYRTGKYLDEYADLILKAEKSKYIDEIAFTIAHTSKQALIDENAFPELYADNVKILYENDAYIDYADIVDYGNFNDKDYYSTVRYKFNNSGVIEEREFPREIYYWYIVHPKITEELPTYIDPETGNPAPPSENGKFWRDYLFNHADDEYPPDPGNGVDYPKDENPPLLKEKLAGIQILYDGVPYNAPRGYDNNGHNNTRPWGYKDHAIEAVSNWVAKTLPLNEQESNDGERPVQPVRIAHHHNGNCGELQDLTVSAARTAMIPAAGVVMIAEDHVWNEFYENGWHQWDNYWSDGGSVIDNFGNYWYGWGERGGSGIFKHHGDDHISDVTYHYVPDEFRSKVIINVYDRYGNPVDGARVVMASHWLAESQGLPITVGVPGIWNYTDANGQCIFELAGNNFTIKVVSKLGNAGEDKTYIGYGETYEFDFTLEGAVPKPAVEINEISVPSNGEYKLEVDYEVVSAYQFPPNPENGNYHPQFLRTGLHLDSFICDSQNLIDYLKGYEFDGLYFSENANSDSISFIMPDGKDWFFVISNEDSIETTKVINITVNLYQKTSAPEIEITHPFDGQVVSGDVIVEGTASDPEDEIEYVEVRIDDGEWSIADGTDKWRWNWNTNLYSEGEHSINARAFDGIAFAYDSIEVTVSNEVDETKPYIEITSPTTYNVKGKVKISAEANDEHGIDKVEFYIDNVLRQSKEKEPYEWEWDTLKESNGEHEIKAKAYDKSGNEAYDKITVNVNNVEEDDFSAPEVSITSPSDDVIKGIVCIEVSASDESGIAKVEFYIDNELKSTDIDEPYRWEWDTTAVNDGEHTIKVIAYDASKNHNSKEALKSVTVDNNEDTTPPSIEITSPTKKELNGIVLVEASASDESGIERVEFYIDDGHKATDYDVPYQWYWDTTEYADGEHEILIKAVDNVGNENSKMLTVTVKNVNALVVTIEEPSDGEQVSGIVIIKGTAKNDEIRKVEVRIEGGEWNVADGAEEWSYIWDTRELENDHYTIEVRAYDGFSYSSVVEITVYVSNSRAVDLRIFSSDISVFPENPKEGDTLIITALVRNDGNIDAEDVRVRFYIDERLIDSYIIDSIGCGESKSAEVSWKVRNPGRIEIKVAIEPGENEISIDDNEAVKIMEIREEKKSKNLLPGFESILVVIAILVLILKRRLTEPKINDLSRVPYTDDIT